MANVPTTDQLRHAIDSGATGEKVGHPDSAAAPLGTDAEAGGNPPTREERAMEARAQTTHREPRPRNYLYLIIVVLVSAIMLLGGYASLANR